jgi:LPXTG-motif cell wall-anchored protein
VGASTNYDGDPTDPKNCAGGDWDGGAILVANGGASSITLTGLTVTLPLPLSNNPGKPSCAEPPRPITFDLWFGQKYYYGNLSDPAYDGGPITIPPGGQAIFTGTSADGAYTCPSGNYPSGPTGGTYDFDTTDANFLSGCTPTTDTTTDPQIVFSATGYSPTTYIDEGHVIDTGGIDVGNCAHTAANPEWPSESLGWRVANSACGEGCPTNQLGVSGSTTQASVVTATGGSPNLTLYLIGAAAVVVVAGLIGFGAFRRKKAT